MPGSPFDYQSQDPYAGMDMSMPTEDYYGAMSRNADREMADLSPEDPRRRLRALQKFGQVYQPGLTGNAGQGTQQMMSGGGYSPQPQLQQDYQLGQSAGQLGSGLYNLFSNRNGGG